MKRQFHPHVLVTNKLRSYGAALKDRGLQDDRETGRWANNRAENSHQPFRRRERAMLRFRRMRSLQKFVAPPAAAVSPAVLASMERTQPIRGRTPPNRSGRPDSHVRAADRSYQPALSEEGHPVRVGVGGASWQNRNCRVSPPIT
jgi:hypothetical protein